MSKIPQLSPLLFENATRSRDFFDHAKEVIPGGVTAQIKHFDPHPVVMEKGDGSKLYDVDGNQYIDYLLSYGALIHGHGHPNVINAVMNQMKTDGSTIFGTPHQKEVEMAEKLIHLYPGIEMVRYTNSGLEATLLAIRTALAVTGKPKLAKFEGHYHGGHDQVLVSVNPGKRERGKPEQPQAVLESTGIPDYYVKNTVVLPFNQLDACEKILREQADEIGCLILEPVQGGFIPAEKVFIEGIRKLTEELNIVLIFDEVKTGFRVGLGGAQGEYGIQPDLTTLGKVLGGGFPIGVLGGSKEIMALTSGEKRDLLSTGAEQRGGPDAVFHSGTYNGHPTVLAAGLATIHELEKEEAMDELFRKTQHLRDGLENVYRSYGLPMQTIGTGSIFNLLLTDKKVLNYRDLSKADFTLRREIDLQLLAQGIYTKPLNRYSMSTVHSEEDLESTIHCHEQAIKEVLKK
ncbi:aspartate aminotransferase family protein [Halobacillus salinarum]|uniref:Aspartate aminotransferase family protein n=1 Tax=Halobacillus salinarum TaxID=2932257 RepID=A0ABY4EL99_9BACI|nr:aspartate aminotransferase family protein [Halobacillus salinarum]UOQ42866.1 aspartate aminotransferase family protein [Halobacillus salinarum]